VFRKIDEVETLPSCSSTSWSCPPKC